MDSENNNQNAKIIIIFEDDPLYLDVDMYEPGGNFKVELFENYQEFEKRVGNLELSNVFAVLLDHNMGNGQLNGEEVFEKLTKDPRFMELNLGPKILGTSNGHEQSKYLTKMLGKENILRFVDHPEEEMQKILSRENPNSEFALSAR